jgi:hypothetical protein
MGCSTAVAFKETTGSYWEECLKRRTVIDVGDVPVDPTPSLSLSLSLSIYIYIVHVKHF